MLRIFSLQYFLAILLLIILLATFINLYSITIQYTTKRTACIETENTVNTARIISTEMIRDSYSIKTSTSQVIDITTMNNHEHIERYKMEEIQTLAEQTRHVMLKVSQHLATAHRYARSGITMLEINSAYSLVQNIIHNNTVQLTHQNLRSMSDIIQDDALDDNSVERPDECPEEYVENLQTFRIVNCKKKAIEHVVSFVFLLPNCKVASNILFALPERYRNIRVVVGVEEMSDECKSLNKLRLNKFELIRSKVADNGSGWRRLLSRVDTKYVLIGRDLYSFNNEANIERLIRIVSVTGVDAMGGAQRLKNGHWSTGCYQMAIKNYTLKLVEGYDQSYNSCIYCDYLSTAFISRRDILLNKLSSTMSGASLFVDYFMKLFRADKIGAMSCPDVMFSTINNDISNQSREMWQTVAREWKLNRIVLPNNKDIWFDCQEASIKCEIFTNKSRGEITPPCCLNVLFVHLKKLFNHFKNHSVDLELFEGSLIGAVKFQNLLPWEIDADFIVDLSNIYKAKSLIQKFSDLYGNIELGKFTFEKQLIYFTSWFIEVYFKRIEGSTTNLTQVNLNGIWMNSPPNPVLSLRNLFGGDIFQHVEHWRPLFNNKLFSNWTNIYRGYYVECKNKFHGCLKGNYLPVGNLQFQDIWI